MCEVYQAAGTRLQVTTLVYEMQHHGEYVRGFKRRHCGIVTFSMSPVRASCARCVRGWFLSA